MRVKQDHFLSIHNIWLFVRSRWPKVDFVKLILCKNELSKKVDQQRREEGVGDWREAINRKFVFLFSSFIVSSIYVSHIIRVCPALADFGIRFFSFVKNITEKKQKKRRRTIRNYCEADKWKFQRTSILYALILIQQQVI